MIDSLSDLVLLLCLAAGLLFSSTFALGSPRVWFRDPLGWVIFLYSLSVDALLFLIVYGIVFGQKIEEPYRLAISLALLGALLSKIWILHQERVQGRLALTRPATIQPEEGEV